MLKTHKSFHKVVKANISIICIIIIIAINCGAYIMHQVLLQELHIISRSNDNRKVSLLSHLKKRQLMFREAERHIQGGIQKPDYLTL